MTKEEIELIKRVKSRITMYKGEALYYDKYGFDFQKYLTTPNAEQAFLEDYGEYLSQETEVDCSIDDIKADENNNAIITINVGELQVEQVLTGFENA